ncbi:MAG: tRNA (guanosine(37)-N1)-methyltransferase TrmD [Bdellovibrionales bacterium GWC1_52_8]|nr:MAG: tRNA (guanosine(37)-N1)-methyltransferase TrmD [Bdellovibrionales bacterium GWB1_52_6]OFZ03703.1 MAG: tRNA (guanosine(37)-N1)-methyltransferase TrmD [Bdellovibrionales bacterium GWA1_52_35]OFZ37481.1 MAG: tRNA (guanosine(37)-N1)-methyltransferase TrmD [Bdellovibrionales bacterium GWC1_52_8]
MLGLYFLTLFPGVFEPIFGSSLLGKAREKGLVSFDLIQIRDFAKDKHRTVDDTPYGGGEGMLMKVDVLHAAWSEAQASIAQQRGDSAKVLTIFLSPQGPLFNQPMAHEFKTYTDLIFVCGHYEGVDERFIELCVDREVSIGDYVLTGGELPAMVMADTIVRLLPGVVGNDRSLTEDSLERGLLKYPQYTRPREFQGREAPGVLLGGDHKQIAEWRSQQMLERTQRKRPDLWRAWKAKGGK